jgi:hypothetical protein
MAVLRFLASVLLLVATIALISDVTRWRTGATHGLEPLTIARQWGEYAPSSLIAARNVVGRTTHPLVWRWGVRPVIDTPLFVLFGALALATGYLGRRRRRINVFTN